MTETTMTTKSALMLKVLLNHFHAGVGENFLKALPQEETKEVFKQNTSAEDISLALTGATELIARTHYSWLAPVVQKIPLFLQKSMIASFSEQQAVKLQKLLKVDDLPKQLSVSVKQFLQGQFSKAWEQNSVLPIAYLPPSKLSPLLALSKVELVELIDFLALYDVAEAIRHIVDKTKLKAIYSCLSHQKQLFLRTCLQKKERVAAPKLDIEKWDGNAEKLNLILHRRGMFRLGKALCGQSSSFLWHVVHTLDIGRGKTILGHYSETEVAGITPFIILQVLAIIDFLKKKSDV